jgi:hypothetical protein
MSSGPEERDKKVTVYRSGFSRVNIERVRRAAVDACTAAEDAERVNHDTRHAPDIATTSRPWPKPIYNLIGVLGSDEGPTMASSETYPYQPLDFDTHEIRVLSLRIEEENKIISCSLEHLSLIEPGPYFALSYCWGNPGSRARILLGGGTAEVTASLEEALRAVRKSLCSVDGIGKLIRIWVDALCINQNDGQERSQQVRNMRQIYSRATEVFAWVGRIDRTKLSEEAISCLFDLPEWAKLYPSSNGLQLSINEAATGFFGEEYWRRVWIIQEVTVASTVTILYGYHKFRWDDVAAVLRYLQKAQLDSESACAKAIHGAAHLLNFRDQYNGQNLMSLFDAMTWSRRSLATDPRDKIFALLGLCHDGPIFVPVPNYKQDLATIIAEMSKMMMSRTKSLDLICLKGVGSSTAMDSLPSWAPNWGSVWSGKLTIQEEEIIHQVSRRYPDYDSPILQGSNNKILKIKGARVAVVTGLATAFGHHNSVPLGMKHRGWISSTSKLRERKPELATMSFGGDITRTIIWDTLTMSLFKEERVVGNSCFESLWRPDGRGMVEDINLIHWIDDNAWFKIGRWTLREWSQVVVLKDSPPTAERAHKSGFKLFAASSLKKHEGASRRASYE